MIDLFNNQPAIIRKDIESALGVSQSFANKILREMIEQNLIESVGQNFSLALSIFPADNKLYKTHERHA